MPARMPPNSSGVRAPIRTTKPPDQRDAATIMAMNGNSAPPAAAGE